MNIFKIFIPKDKAFDYFAAICPFINIITTSVCIFLWLDKKPSNK